VKGDVGRFDRNLDLSRAYGGLWSPAQHESAMTHVGIVPVDLRRTDGVNQVPSKACRRSCSCGGTLEVEEPTHETPDDVHRRQPCRRF
jgi:hypothetical protein